MSRSFKPVLVKCIVAALTSLSCTVGLHAQLPDLGGEDSFPTGTERKVGDRIAKEIYRDPDYLDDPILVGYLDSIWQPLLKAARDRGDMSAELSERFAWKLFLDRDASVNAFALPGGYMGINTGLVAMTTHRAEIASVLAHELSHVTQRHIARGIAQQNRQQPLIIAAMLLGAATITKNPELANAAIVGSQAVAVQGQLNFSRDMEREADRVGFGILTSAGFEPSGMSSMFQKLEHSSRLNDNGLYPYLRSHPLTSERIADAQSRATNANSVGALGEDVLDKMMSVRARILSAEGVDVLASLSAEPQSMAFTNRSVGNRVAALYGACLASHKLRDQTLARKQCAAMQQLIPTHSPDAEVKRYADLLLAEIEVQDNTSLDKPRLAALLNQQILPLLNPDLTPTRRAALLLWAQGQIRLGNAAQASSALSKWVSAQPGDAHAWRLLAQAAEAQGQILASVRAGAEAQAAELDYAGAMERLRAAQKLPDIAHADHFEQSIIQSRLSTIVQQHRNQVDDEKTIK